MRDDIPGSDPLDRLVLNPAANCDSKACALERLMSHDYAETPLLFTEVAACYGIGLAEAWGIMSGWDSAGRLYRNKVSPGSGSEALFAHGVERGKRWKLLSGFARD